MTFRAGNDFISLKEAPLYKTKTDEKMLSLKYN